ncbi:MAG: ABC transporter ATP-binding protein/permease [Maledivibacter sp.]|jgi:ATP-binding cassette subfamily B protein|nr:ABC transporter ATP-binding protein/permease [Maledivibacter sp.]
MKNNAMDLKKKYKGKNKFSSVLMALSVVLGVISMFIVIGIVRLYSVQQLTTASILKYGFGIALCQVLKALLYALSIHKAHDVAYSSLVEIRLDIINHLKKMPISFFQERKTGDLANIINHDVEQVEVYLAHAYPEIIVATLIPTTIFISLLFVDWRLAFALVSTIPIMWLLMGLFHRFWGEQFQIYNQSTKRMSEDLLEYIATIPVIKAFSKDENRTEKILDTMHSYIKWVKKMTAGISIPMGIIGLFIEGGIVVLSIVGSILLSNNLITTEQFILSIILGGVFVSSFAKLSTFQHKNIVFGKTINSINTILGVKEVGKDNISEVADSTQIEFKDVTFSYNKEKNALQDINLMFKKNSVNAIVGASGSGKSTIANLIMGFYGVDKGEVRVGGKNIENMDEGELRKLVSIVQQDVFLFNLSIEENIRIGKKNASREEVIEAAKKAQLHDMIMTLKNGYDTVVGESGAKLSGGEKQRISIARMILKDAPVIILDEATSAIDPYNEFLIQRAIDNLAENKTIIMIAHHLNTIVNANQIVVMQEGRVIEKGIHEELVDSCCLYKQMIEEQRRVDNWEIKEAV